jgi:hypothetical protein
VNGAPNCCANIAQRLLSEQNNKACLNHIAAPFPASETGQKRNGERIAIDAQSKAARWRRADAAALMNADLASRRRPYRPVVQIAGWQKHSDSVSSERPRGTGTTRWWVHKLRRWLEKEIWLAEKVSIDTESQ